MRIFSFRKIQRLFSFASMGIARANGRGVRRRNAFKQRRDAFNRHQLGNEALEPRRVLAAAIGADMPDLATADDSFPSTIPSLNNDNITNENQPLIEFSSGATFGTGGPPPTAGETLVLQVNNTTWPTVGGAQTVKGTTGTLAFQINKALPDGDHVLRIKTTDAAGVSAFSDELDLTIDTTPPTVLGGSVDSGTFFATNKIGIDLSFSEDVIHTTKVQLSVGTPGPATTAPQTEHTALVDTLTTATKASDFDDEQAYVFTVVDDSTGTGTHPDGDGIETVDLDGTLEDLAGNTKTGGIAFPTSFSGLQASTFVLSVPITSASFFGVLNNDQISYPLSGLTLLLPSPVPGPPATPINGLAVNLEDFQLTRDGVLIPIPDATLSANAAGTATQPAFTEHLLGDLEQYTNEPGRYRLAFVDRSIAPLTVIEWVKSVPTAGELIATLTPFPTDTTPTTPRNIPVEGIALEFLDNAGNPTPVIGVDTTAVGGGSIGPPAIPAITQFEIYKDGVLVPWTTPGLNAVNISGSGSNYSINGLASFTNSDGYYQVILSDSSAIETLDGTQLITAYSTSWEFTSKVTVSSVTPPLSSTYKNNEVLSFDVNFSDFVNIDPASPPTLTIDIGGQLRTATYAAGDGTQTLTFNYTVGSVPGSDDIDLDGIELRSPLSGTVTDLWGTAVDPRLTPPSMASVFVLSTTPTIPPTIDSIESGSTQPRITGTAQLSDGDTLSVVVAGISNTYHGSTYTVVPVNNTWTLDMSAVDPDNVELQNCDIPAPPSAVITVPSTDELKIGMGVSGHPDIPAGAKILTVGATSITLDTSVTTGVGTLGTTLTFSATPTEAALTNPDNYSVTAIITDAAGNTIDETDVFNTGTTAPTIETLVTSSDVPTIRGSAVLQAGESLSITVNGATYGNVTTSNVTTAGDIATGSFEIDNIDTSDLVVGLVVNHSDFPVGTIITAIDPTGGSGGTNGKITVDKASSVITPANPTSITFENLWSLDLGTVLPSTGTLGAFVDGVAVDVVATVFGSIGYSITDTTTGELTVDRTLTPVAPGLDLGPNVLGARIASTSEATDATGIVTVSGEAGSKIHVTFTGTAGVYEQPPIDATGATAQPVVLTSGNLTTIGDGLVTVSAIQTDAAGNESPAATTTFTLDNTDPADMTIGLALNVTSPVGTAVATDPAGVVVVSGGELDAEITVTFTDSVTPTANVVTKTLTGTDADLSVALDAADLKLLEDGTITVAVIQTDEAGNVQGGTPAASTTFTLDTEVPDAVSITLKSGLENGATTSEAIEADAVTILGETSATVTVTFTGPNGSVVKTIESATGGTTYDNLDDALSVNDLVTLGNGTISISAVQTDAAGNAQTDPAATASFGLGASLAATPDLVLGAGVTDQINEEEMLIETGVVMVTGTLNATITVTFDDGVNSAVTLPVITGTGVAQPVVFPAANLNGAETNRVETGNTITITASQTDILGNVSAEAELVVTLDTDVPSAPTLALGTNVSGGATTEEATHPSGVVTVTGEQDAAIAVTFENAAGTTVVKSLTGDTTAQAVVLLAADLVTLGDGPVSVSAIQTDLAGNESPAATASFDLVTAVVAAPGLALGADVDGVVSTDEATATTGIVTVSGVAGNTIIVTFTGTAGVVTADPVTATGATAQPVTLDETTDSELTTLGNGLVTVSAIQTDAAGNESPAATTTFTLDNTKPADMTIGLALDVTSPVGTAVATDPAGVVVVSGGEENAEITVTFTDSVTPTANVVTKTLTGTDADLSVALDAADLKLLEDGTITVAVIQTDEAGNVQGGTPAASTTFTLDTEVPDAVSITLKSGLENGATTSEAIEADAVTILGETSATVTVTFTGPNGSVVKTIESATGGTTYDNLDDALSVNDLVTLGNGTISISAVQTDAAGNAQTDPAATASFGLGASLAATPDLVLGAGVTDQINEEEMLIETGVVMVTGTLNATITVTFDDGVNSAVTLPVITGTGVAQPVVFPAANLNGAETNRVETGNTITITASQTDILGNVSAEAELVVTLDTDVPSAPTLALGTNVSGGATTEEATHPSGVVTVTGEQDAAIAVTFENAAGTTVVKSLTGDTTAQAVVLLAADLVTLGDGPVSVSAIQTDLAGNESPAATASFDLVTAVVAAPGLALGADVDGVVSTDEATATTGIVTVSGVAGNTIIVTFTGTAGVVTADPVTATGATAQPVTLDETTDSELTTLGNGLVTVSAIQTDAAGNESPAATTTFTLDNTKPADMTIGLALDVTSPVGTAVATDPAGVVVVSGGEENAEITVTFTDSVTPTANVVTKTLTGTDADLSVALDAADLKLLEDGTITVAVIQTDEAGNVQGGTPAASTTFTLDTTIAITAVRTSTPDGTYRDGQPIAIEVHYSENVTVDTTAGSPTLTLNSGGTASYVTSANNVLNFTYTPGLGENATDLDVTAFNLNNAVIEGAAGNAPSNTGIATKLSSVAEIVIDTTAPTTPTVTPDVTLSLLPVITGTTGTGAALPANETLTVVVKGATYNPVADSDGDWSLNLATTQPVSGTLAQFVNGEYVSVLATVTDAAGNSASETTINEIGINTNPLILNVAPAANTPDGTYDINDEIDIEVRVSQPVLVSGGVPTLTLNAGTSGNDAVATFIGDTFSYSDTLLFRYKVRSGDDTEDLDYKATDSLNLGGATIVNDQGNPLFTTTPGTPNLDIPGSVNSISFSNNIVVNTAPPSVEKIETVVPNGSYGLGQTIPIVATLSEIITAGQTFDVMLDTGRTVTLTTTTTELATGNYVVQAGDTSADLDVIDIPPNAALSVVDSSGYSLLTNLPTDNIGSLKNIVIDSTPPTVASFTTSKTDGLYGAGTAIDLTVTMSEPVRANSSMDITLNTGAVVRVAAASAGTTLSGTYTVDGTDSSVADLSVASYSSIVVRDAAGNPIASTSLPTFPNNLGDASDIQIDTSSPTITSISAQDGLYSENDTITLTAQLSEAIEAGKNIELTLDTGDVITFTTDGTDVVSADYTVGSGDNSTDLSVTKAAASGTVNDAAGNPFHALLPAGLNLSDTSDVVVDTTAPTVVSIVPDSTSLNASQTATLTITLSEDSTNFDVADLAENTSGQFASFSGSGSSYTVEFTPGADFEGTATISVTDASFTDLAGNSFVVGSTVATIDVDTRAPTIIGTPDDSDLSKGETATITFTLSEDSTNFDNTVLTPSNGTLSTVSGSGSSYTVVFTPTDDFEGTGGVTIAGGVLTDLAGNPNESSSVDLTIDTLAPTVTINSDKASVGGNDGSTVETATITFTLSEDSSDFDSSDVDIDFGSLSNWNPVSATVYEATFTPDFNFNGPVTVAVNAGTFTDPAPAGNVNTATTQETIAVNTVRPTISISSAPTTAIGGPNTATITFTLSADSTDFTLSDVAVSGGQLTGLTGSGSSYTATFTPPANSTTTETISVAENVFTDGDGNGNTAATPASILVDTVAPNAPTVSLSASANSPVSKAEATSAFGIVDVTGGEAGATMNVLFTGSNGQSITKSATGPSDSIQLTESDLNTLGDGDVAVTATQTDTAGNESPVSSPLEFVLDSIAPEVTGFSSSSPAGEYGLGATITLIASLSEPAAAGQSFFATLNTGSSVEFTTSAGGLTLTGTYTVAGTHNANPLAIATIISSGSVADTSGNPLSTDLPTQITFDGIEIDTIAPQPATVSLVATDPVSAAEAVAPTGFATVQGEAGASIVVTITGTNGTLTRNPLGTGSAQVLSLTEAELPTLGEGLVTLTAVQTDAAGNRQITPDSEITFTLDTTPPSPLGLSLGAGVASGATVAEATQATGIVRLTGEAGASITVTVTDSAGTQHVLNPIIGTGSEQAVRATIADLSVLADGLLVISAVQSDAAGNTQIIPTELTVVLDRVAPNAPNLTIRDNVSSPLTLGETTDTNGVVNVLGENGAAIAVSFSGQNGGFTKNLTGTGFNQPIALDATEAAILGEGSVAITATQTDAAGNTSIQGTLPVIIDQTAPEVLALTLDAQAGFYGEGDSIPLSGELSEPANPGQILRVVLNVLEADNVTPVVVDVTVAANGTDLAGAYVVQAGHNKDDLSINSFTNDHPSHPVTDVAGNPLLDSSSSSGGNQKSSASSSGFVGGQSSGIVVDTVAPEVIEWITTEGTYVVDDIVQIQLRVDEPAAAGSTINVRTNTLSIFRPDIILNLDANDPTLFTGQYTVALGERADELVLSVVSANTTDRAGNSLNLGSIAAGNQSGRIIRGSISLSDSENGMQWGPNHEDGSPSVLINLSTGVTGLDIDAVTLNVNGRTVSLRDASMSQTSHTNYILRLPQRLASLQGGFTITIWSSDIRSILDPDVGMDDPIEFTLPDAGMNTDSETGSR